MTDKDLLATARGFRRGMIGRKKGRGYCGYICEPLAGLLCALGEPCLVVQGWVGKEPHVWIDLGGRILDPTADQFGYAPVYVGRRPRRYRIDGARVRGVSWKHPLSRMFHVERSINSA